MNMLGVSLSTFADTSKETRFQQTSLGMRIISRKILLPFNCSIKLGLTEGDLCLDVGCGVGGPMREIAKFSGANVIGINNNAYQAERNSLLFARLGLDKLCAVVKGDFHQMPFPSNYFDNAYAIEATCHAKTLEDVYGEVFRTLKPGGVFCDYEWLTTARIGVGFRIG